MEFRPVLDSLLRSPSVRSVVEIGSEHGGFSKYLMELAATGVLDRVKIIEPFPVPELVELAEKSNGKCAIVDRLSLDALSTMSSHDVYFLDGDHNYYTVLNELNLIFSTNPDALVVLHDVIWPCARRDMYYSPASVPVEHQQAHSFDIAIVPGNPRSERRGFESRGAFAIALQEGGPLNGVLTAVEDFMSQRDGMKLDIIPVVFGLGVLRRTGHPLEKNISDLLPSAGYAALLERLEANRLENWIELLPDTKTKSRWENFKGRIRKFFGASRDG